MIINSYCSWVYFAAFLPLAIILYFISPKKLRPYTLLLESYIFFYLASEFLLIYILATTLLTYFTALGIGKIQDKCKVLCDGKEKDEKKAITQKFKTRQLAVLTVSIVILIGVLSVLKYTKFFFGNVNSVLGVFDSDFRLPLPSFLAPIGISFYTLEAVSYVTDVYRKKLTADKSLLKVALYLGFFPTVMEGPICKYDEVTGKILNGDTIHFRDLKFSLQRIILGLFKKMLVADRLNMFVKTVYDSYESFDGTIMLLAAIAYTLQLYTEFSGTMDIVIGSAEIFGIRLPENFNQPFFSKSVSEFWQRWHITLGRWFKDYIYYPISMTKKSKQLTKTMRKKLGSYYGPMVISTIALFCVWFCNGMWHGSGNQYIFFGMYHFVLITLGNFIKPTSKKLYEKLKIEPDSKALTAFQTVRTAFFVCIGELFFRANSLTAGFEMMKIMITKFSFKTFVDGTILNIGMDIYDIVIVFLAVIVLFIIGILREKGVDIRQKLSEQPIALRWSILILAILIIVIFGAYGDGYTPVDPIYADF